MPSLSATYAPSCRLLGGRDQLGAVTDSHTAVGELCRPVDLQMAIRELSVLPKTTTVLGAVAPRRRVQVSAAVGLGRRNGRGQRDGEQRPAAETAASTRSFEVDISCPADHGRGRQTFADTAPGGIVSRSRPKPDQSAARGQRLQLVKGLPDVLRQLILSSLSEPPLERDLEHRDPPLRPPTLPLSRRRPCAPAPSASAAAIDESLISSRSCSRGLAAITDWRRRACCGGPRRPGPRPSGRCPPHLSGLIDRGLRRWSRRRAPAGHPGRRTALRVCRRSGGRTSARSGPRARRSRRRSSRRIRVRCKDRAPLPRSLHRTRIRRDDRRRDRRARGPYRAESFRHFADKREVLFGGQDALPAALRRRHCRRARLDRPDDAVGTALAGAGLWFEGRHGLDGGRPSSPPTHGCRNGS